MIKILTVCGNGIGSSLMCAMKIEEICKEEGIQAEVASSDFNSVAGKGADLIVTVKQLADQLKEKYPMKTRVIGDCYKLGKIGEAVREGFFAASSLD